MNRTSSVAAVGAGGLLFVGFAGVSPAAPTPPTSTQVSTQVSAQISTQIPGRPGDPADPGGARPLLAEPARGADAVSDLGDSIEVAAARNDLPVTDLRTLLRTDRTAWLDTRGQVYYMDSFETPRGAGTTARAPYPYAETFALHSNPGSSMKVFLDFDGHTVSDTAWNYNDGVGTGRQPAFDTDGVPSEFSSSEQDRVQSIWARVSEDFAPFDVDVTTEDPGAAGMSRSSAGDTSYGMRALITPSASAAEAICGGSCGGVAYLGIFNSIDPEPYYQPAWVFSHKLSNSDPKAVAEAVSHEVGHTLGLDHDGFGNERDGYGYYTGHGSWAPIMGAGYSKAITQWSIGEFGTGTNTEDDLSVMTDNGVALRSDEAGETRAEATVLATSGDGVITDRADQDYYSVDRACTEPVTVTATPAPTAPNLDIGLSVYAADGTLVDSANPASGSSGRDNASGLGASLTTTVPVGIYYIEVDGVGARNPATDGYSDYGSLGRYRLSASACGDPDIDPDPGEARPDAPGIGSARAGAAGGTVTATATWTAPTGGGPVTGYRVNALRMSSSGAVLSRTVSGERPASGTSFAMPLPRKGKYRFTVSALNAAGTSPVSARSNKVAGR